MAAYPGGVLGEDSLGPVREWLQLYRLPTLGPISANNFDQYEAAGAVSTLPLFWLFLNESGWLALPSNPVRGGGSMHDGGAIHGGGAALVVKASRSHAFCVPLGPVAGTLPLLLTTGLRVTLLLAPVEH